jgi:hypothetical protein
MLSRHVPLCSVVVAAVVVGMACERRPPDAPKVAQGGPSDGQEGSWAGAYVSAREGAELLDEEGQPFGALPLRAPIEALGKPAHAGRAIVHVAGAVEAWGELEREALGRFAREDGRLDGPPRAIVTAGDVVQVLEPPTAARVRVRALVRSSWEQAEGRPLEIDGALASTALSAEPVEQGTLGEGGFTEEGVALTLLDAPEGKVVWSLPVQAHARPVRVLGRQGPWTHVAFGDGPYLDAWTRAPIRADEVVTTGREPTIPASIGAAGTLLCVRAETEVRAGARLLAKTHVATWARQLAKPDEDKRTVKVRLGTRGSVTVTGTIDLARARMVVPTDPRCS